jgi:diguanylate cyclase (GGDEF)-like protein/PAS domain S-box-containing protein
MKDLDNIDCFNLKTTLSDDSENYNIGAITNDQGIIECVNDKFCELSGYSRDELIGKTFKMIRHPETPGFVYQQLWDNLKVGKVWKGIFKNRSKDGRSYVMSTMIIPMKDKYGNIVKYRASAYEITDYISEINKYSEASKHHISGLYNREIMMYDLEHRDEKNIKIVIIDIDSFKSVNDYYGYKIGDELIKAVSDKLIDIVSEDFQIYHISIDEFALVRKSDTDIDSDCMSCQKISDILETEHIHLISGLDIDISVSIGLSNGQRSWDVIKQADLAVSYAKSYNIPVVNFHNVPELNQTLENRIKWTKEIRNALANDNIVPWIQAIRDNKTGQIIKFEALMRMIDDHESIISPFHFLEISKKTKLYEKLSHMMIDKTLAHFSNNHDSFNINLTWDDIKTQSMKNLIFEYLANFQDLGPRMTIEMVESENITNATGVDDFISSVRKYGVQIAIDDFGSGYSNFVYLEQLEADYIKIDGSLIKGMMERENTLFLVESIVKIAKQFGIKTVAEFVSSEEIQKKVDELGIDYSQGFYIGKPRPINW